MRQNRGSQTILLLALGLVVVWAAPAQAEKAPAGATTAPARRLLQEVNTHFTLEGKPVHPRLLRKFQTFLSDSGPPAVVSVDLLAAAQDDNEYYYPDVKVKDGFVSYNEQDGSEFTYKWLGTVRPGLHVVETYYSGGGTGVFMNLYFFRASLGTGQGEKGPYAQILLTLMRTPVILGDRDDGDITVAPGQVVIGKSRYRNQPVILNFK